MEKDPHSLAIVSDDPDCGYAARLQVLETDSYPSDDFRYPRQRSGLSIDVTKYSGDEVWVAWSVKFASDFQTYPSGRTGEHLITDDWHTIDSPSDGQGNNHGISGGLVCWGMPAWGGSGGFPPAGNLGQLPGTPANMWSLFIDTYTYNSSTNQNSSADRIFLLNVPMNRGNWIDVMMHLKFHPSTGFVEAWINNERQTFLTGGQRWTGQTSAPGGYTDGYYPVTDLYRGGAMFGTQTKYFSNYRIASNRESL